MSFNQSAKRLLAACLLGAMVTTHVYAEADTPAPKPSTNAAAHYCRALLLLSSMPPASREMLSKPIWEVFGDASKEEIHAAISPVVFEGRHAIRAALQGSIQKGCQFGIDYCDTGQGTAAYHAPLMLQLNRLVTLSGIKQKIDGDDRLALGKFLAALKMGRHMADEPTLIEMLVGIEMMENAYFTLALWGTRCADPALAEVAFRRVEDSQWQLDPSKMMMAEAAILDEQVDRVIKEFPDGRWAEMMLESWGELADGNSRDELKGRLLEVAEQRGIRAEIFEDRASFEEAAKRFRATHVDYFQESAVCLQQSGMARAKCAAEIHDKFRPQFDEVGDSHFIDVQDVARHVATSEAERVMARVALAVAASRQADGKYPASLDTVAGKFGGKLPTSPYDGSAVKYTVLNDGQDFAVQVAEATFGDVVMPAIDFTSVRNVESTPEQP